jgi:hypothetical protein
VRLATVTFEALPANGVDRASYDTQYLKIEPLSALSWTYILCHLLNVLKGSVLVASLGQRFSPWHGETSVSPEVAWRVRVGLWRGWEAGDLHPGVAISHQAWLGLPLYVNTLWATGCKEICTTPSEDCKGAKGSPDLRHHKKRANINYCAIFFYQFNRYQTVW